MKRERQDAQVVTLGGKGKNLQICDKLCKHFNYDGGIMAVKTPHAIHGPPQPSPSPPRQPPLTCCWCCCLVRPAPHCCR